ncbi:MAG: hypothetical protein AAFZ52_11725, partial [Bacteroidota bacterium]
LVAGCWLLVAGCWLLVAGCWKLVTGAQRPKPVTSNGSEATLPEHPKTIIVPLSIPLTLQLRAKPQINN